MKLIGLHGRAGSGKDTAVQFIQQAAGPACNVQRAGFADKLKKSFLEALGFDTKQMTRDEVLDLANQIKDSGSIVTNWASEDGVRLYKRRISGRIGQQRYGTEAHRDVFEYDFWVNALLPKFEDELTFDADILCVTDTRFPNEAERILDLGGMVWRIDADRRLGPLPADAHSSEHPLPPEYITLTIPNNTTVEQFGVSVRAAYYLSFQAVTT